MVINLDTGLMLVLVVYVLVHSALYFWYRAKRQQRGYPTEHPQENALQADRTGYRPRRVSAGIYRSEGRSRIIVLTAMVLAAIILAVIAVSSISAHFSSP